MILTITLNPSMDYNYLVSSLTLDQVNRVENPHTSIGVKGLMLVESLHSQVRKSS